MLYLLATIVLLTTLACETAAKRGWLPYWVSRKILHVVAVGACAVATTIASAELLLIIVGVAEVVLVVLVASGKLMRDETGRPAWGIVWFPLAFMWLLWTYPTAWFVPFAMWTLALCDPAATIAGKLFAKSTYQLTGDAKSWIGNLGFVLSFLALCQVTGTTGWLGPTNMICLALLLAAGEAVGSKGLDNLIVPLLCAFFLWHLGQASSPSRLLLFPLIAAVLFCWLMVKRGSLTVGGAIAASLLGIIVLVSTQDWRWLLPLVLFLGSSSLIGKILPSRTAAGDAKQQQPRDATQVLANGAVYGYLAHQAAFYLQYNDEGFFCSFLPFHWEALLLTAAAIATADTWSSEIGQYFRRPTVNLLTGKPVPPGLSGGVSWPGTLAGLAGAAFIPATCFWLLPDPSLDTVLSITAFGFGGMLLDSVLGSRFQAKYFNSQAGGLRDTPATKRDELIRGYAWMTNDLVNFLAILIGVWLFDLLTNMW